MSTTVYHSVYSGPCLAALARSTCEAFRSWIATGTNAIQWPQLSNFQTPKRPPVSPSDISDGSMNHENRLNVNWKCITISDLRDPQRWNSRGATCWAKCHSTRNMALQIPQCPAGHLSTMQSNAIDFRSHRFAVCYPSVRSAASCCDFFLLGVIAKHVSCIANCCANWISKIPDFDSKGVGLWNLCPPTSLTGTVHSEVNGSSTSA